MINVLIVGVGGQGSLLASRLLGNLFLSRGLEVKVNEVHGMSQRGGSVVTTVRAGAQVASPLVEAGQADYLVSFEQLEALRWAYMLKPGGKLISSTQKILPMPVISGTAEYPDISGLNAVWVDALDLAVQAGSAKAANVVVMGALSKTMDFSQDEWMRALKTTLPEKLLELNQRAFAFGRA